MRTDINTGGFTLYEIMISITIVEIITGLLSVYLFPLLERSEFVNTADQIKDSLRQTQWLALNRRESHRFKSEFANYSCSEKTMAAMKPFWRKKYR
jgi:Tfp pilus assembly protein FimT